MSCITVAPRSCNIHLLGNIVTIFNPIPCHCKIENTENYKGPTQHIDNHSSSNLTAYNIVTQLFFLITVIIFTNVNYITFSYATVNSTALSKDLAMI